MKRFRINMILAALLSVLFAPVTAGADDSASIGRLFLTPAERARIDAMRANSESGDRSALSSGERATPVEQVVVNGFVRRSSGPNTVWVNGQSLDTERPRADNIELLRGPDDEDRVMIGKRNEGRADLKPGQTWDPGNDRITDCGTCMVVEPESPADAED